MKTPPAQPKTAGWLALGCAGVLQLMALSTCGLALMVRQYRELTVPMTLLLGGVALVLGWIAYRKLSRRA